MSLKAIFGFDHIGAINSGEANWAKVFGNFPAVLRVTTGSTRRATFTPAGWFTAALTATAGVWTSLVLETAKLSPENPDVTWFGARWKMTATGSVVGGNSIIWASPVNYQSGGTFLAVLTYTDMIAFIGGTIAQLLNREIYIEIGIDYVNNVFKRRINGVEIADLPAGGVASQLANRSVCLFLPACSSASHTAAFRDIYWTSNDGQGVQGPLGPQRVTQLEETVETPTNWTATSGTLDDALALDLGSAANNMDLPALVSPTPKEPIKIKLKFPIGVSYEKINGVAGVISAGLTSGLGSVSSHLERDGVEEEPKLTTLVTGMAHNMPTSISEKAPDGSAWSRTKIDSTNLVVEIV